MQESWESGGPPQYGPMRLQHLATNLKWSRGFGGLVRRPLDPIIRDRHRRHKWLDPVCKGCVIGMDKVGVTRLSVGESEQEDAGVSMIKAFRT